MSPTPAARKILLLVLLAPLPFVSATPTFADEEDAGPDWATYVGDDWSRAVEALAPVADGAVMTLGRFGDDESGDEALVHFDAAGNLQWSVYHGGSEGEGTATSLASAPALDRIYLAGHTTYDSGIATPGAYQSDRECFGVGLCGLEGFVAQFDPTGQLRWGTYFGGPYNEYIHDASADPDGALYVCGETQSATGIATADADQPTLIGDRGGFVAKLGVDGDLEWATYHDHPCSNVAADRRGDGVVIAGWAGYNDASLARYDAAGRRQWATDFGEGHASIDDLQLDPSGAIYTVGATDELESLITSGAHQRSYGGGQSDLYIARFTAGGEREWGTYFGGEAQELAARAAVDDAGNLYVSAMTFSDDLATIGEASETIGDQGDVIVGKFRRDGTLEWAVYYGGEGSEQAGALTVDPDGRIYLAGSTNSQAGIATPGGSRTTPEAPRSAFLAMFRDQP